jgi:hypothetical protein
MQGQGFSDAIRAQYGKDITGVNLQVQIFNEHPARYRD